MYDSLLYAILNNLLFYHQAASFLLRCQVPKTMNLFLPLPRSTPNLSLPCPVLLAECHSHIHTIGSRHTSGCQNTDTEASSTSTSPLLEGSGACTGQCYIWLVAPRQYQWCRQGRPGKSCPRCTRLTL